MDRTVENGEWRDITHILQSTEFSMLCKLKGILDRNQIPFFLAYGTALGCIRHEGFIPWDDDVDIHIYGNDYPRLVKVFETQDTGELMLQDGIRTEGYPYCIPKIVLKDSVLVENSLQHLKYHCGVYIDIFPLYGVSSKPIRKRLECKRTFFRYAIVRARYHKKGAVHLLSFLFPISYVKKKIVRASQTSPFGRLSCSEPTTFSWKQYVKTEWVQQTVLKPFEGVMMPVPKFYDEYLRHYYGDYFVLPPADKQQAKHAIAQLKIKDEEFLPLE